jgi:hypothetical protein
VNTIPAPPFTVAVTVGNTTEEHTVKRRDGEERP